MKKLLIVLMLFSGSVFADPPGYWRHHEHGHWERGGADGWTWVAPTIIGGVIGYEIARQQPQAPVVVQQPVIVQPMPQLPKCSPWTEIQNPDGTITRTRTCNQ